MRQLLRFCPDRMEIFRLEVAASLIRWVWDSCFGLMDKSTPPHLRVDASLPMG